LKRGHVKQNEIDRGGLGKKSAIDIVRVLPASSVLLQFYLPIDGSHTGSVKMAQQNVERLISHTHITCLHINDSTYDLRDLPNTGL
jgi:hypothetical protein